MTVDWCTVCKQTFFSHCICLNKKCKVTYYKFIIVSFLLFLLFLILGLDCVLSLPLPPNRFFPVHLLPFSSLLFLTFPTAHHPPSPFLSPQEFFLIWRLVILLFNYHSFYQPTFLWLVLVSSFLCTERFMLNIFSDQLLKLGNMLLEKTETKDE